MQQRNSEPPMDIEQEDEMTPPLSRGRQNSSKVKVLVRSHAMREETSPPRAPTPTILSPCIRLSPPQNEIPGNNPVVVLSPSTSRGSSPSRSSICISPTSTLVPSPASRCSPMQMEYSEDGNVHICSHSQESNIDSDSKNVSPKYHNNNKGCRQNIERHRCPDVIKVQRDIIVEEVAFIEGKKAKSEIRCICESVNPSCVKCNRNINNNLSGNMNNNVCTSPNTLMVNRVNMRGKLKQQSSSQGSFEGSLSNSPCLSRDSSSEQYTDTTGVDLEQFIPETLNRNAKDRAFMLRIEQELVSLAKDKVKTHFKFPPMSSYQRMLVHRCAAYFGMDHNIESSGKCVVVNKTKNTRIPEVEFKQHIKEDIVFSEEPRRLILKRDSNSIEDYSFKSPDRQCSMESRRSKSFEEREEEYEKVRKRIFNREMQDGSSEDVQWSDLPWSSIESDTCSRLRLPPSEHHIKCTIGRLPKVHSEEVEGDTIRPCVAKSYSFGGYGGGGSVLNRGDSVMSTHSAGPRLLTKQDSAASSVSWRLSPSSSGYKTQSQRSESITPSPTSTPYLSGDSIRQDSTNSMATNLSDIPTSQTDEQTEPQLVWAVTDIHNVPKGCIIIDPKTLEPVKNQDGSVYHYDPMNPHPQIQGNNTVSSKPPISPQKASSPIKQQKERPVSPKKKSRASPIKKSIVTNTATSPSLPFTPPLQHSRSFPFIASNENNLQQQHQYPMYGGSYPPGPEGGVVYQQPCIVYATPSYGIPMPFENRMEPPVQEVPTYYMNVAESSSANQPMSYHHHHQPQTLWSQQPVAFYQNPPPGAPPHRFSVPVATNQGSYLSSSYPPNYIPHPPPPQIPPNGPNSEMLPVYPQQPIQVVYPSPQTQPVYPNQGIIYAQNPVYPGSVYSAQNLSYPQCTSTPNSNASTISNQAFCGQIPDHGGTPTFAQLAHGMSQLNLSGSAPCLNQQQGSYGLGTFGGKPMGAMQSLDNRLQKSGTPKGNKFSNPKVLGMSSSQSSTGTNSPAMTVVAGYGQNAGFYRTPPETPPTPHMGSGSFNPNFVQPIFVRQMSNTVRVSPPMTNRNSRSPTPASDAPMMDRNRPSLPTAMYQGMPYVLHSDPRMATGRSQPSAYRQPTPSRQINQGTDHSMAKQHKNRKLRGNRPNVPPDNQNCQ